MKFMVDTLHKRQAYLRVIAAAGALSLLCATPFFAKAQPNQTDKQGRKQGEWIKTHPETGEVAYRAEFKNDEPVGTTERYYEDGSLQARIEHLNDGKDRAEIFYPDGMTLMAKGNYKDRERDSTWLFFDVDGTLTAEESYRDGKKHGTSRTYYADGSISEKAIFEDGVKNGEWEQYYPDGNLKLKANVVDGVKYEGKFTNYHPNGKPMLEGNYVDGKRESSWYTYLESGAIEVIHVYRAGKIISEHPQNGVFDKYYPDDIKRSEYTYKDGEKHGPFKEYYQQGEWRTEEVADEFGGTRPVQRLYGTQVMKEGKYREGELHGEIITYTPKGKVEKKERYDKGQKVK